MTVRARLLALALATLLAACGGGGGGGSSSASGSGSGGTTPPPAPTNFATVVVDGGPPALQSGANPVYEANTPYVTVTLCAPGTSNCQTIDHVIVDTGSVGLRIPAAVLNPGLLSALPGETDAAGNPVGECYQYVDGYIFGSVRQADFKVGGEQVASMPVQIAGDSGAFATAPSACSSSGGTNLNTVASLGANGIMGVGTTATDCGSVCAAGGKGAGFYFDCPSAGCSGVVARAAATSAPFQQVVNPVAAFAVDNNGTVLSLPVVTTALASVSGTLYFGIGTQSNNALGAATVVPATNSQSASGPGLISVTYKGQTLKNSFIDSGSSLYFFEDASIPQCTGKNEAGYYCPTSPLSLGLTLQGVTGSPANVTITVQNADALLTAGQPVLPNIGGSPSGFGFKNPYTSSFDIGLPFFYGRSVYTAIEGRPAGAATGPFYAF